ncbi:hypothetical protein F5B17DRAFT_68353 [Nemania serpens]|nr:hypothetical protein F5B17DRAFT_68353 [Nemania serpens]
MATFLDLPLEIRLMIYEAMLHLCPMIWNVRCRDLGGSVGVQLDCRNTLGHDENYERRMRYAITLAGLTGESRHYVHNRFWSASVTWCLQTFIDSELDLFCMNQAVDYIPIINESRETYKGHKDSSLWEIVGAMMRNVYLTIERLGGFADGLSSGVFQLPALKRIYVKSHVARAETISPSPSGIPTIPAASVRDESGSVQAIFHRSPYTWDDLSATDRVSRNVKYIGETDGFNRLDITNPVGWKTGRSLNWDKLQHLGVVCVFVHGESVMDRECVTNEFYVFTTTRGPTTPPTQDSNRGGFIDLETMAIIFGGAHPANPPR